MNSSQNSSRSIVMSSKAESLDCGICLQPCQHPAKLPCGHVFCYLCIKGIANRSGTCAFCRRLIPVDFVANPQILDGETSCSPSPSLELFAWFYQAKTSGWWQYQQRDSDELEAMYQRNPEAVFDRLIAGYMYVINFKEMVQHRKNDRSIYRHIKRDKISIGDRVGVAGLRLSSAAAPRNDGCVPSDGSPQDCDTASSCGAHSPLVGAVVCVPPEVSTSQHFTVASQSCSQERVSGAAANWPLNPERDGPREPVRRPVSPPRDEMGSDWQLSSATGVSVSSDHALGASREQERSTLLLRSARDAAAGLRQRRSRRSEDPGVGALMAAMSLSDDVMHERI